MLMKIGDWRLGNLLDKRSPLTPLKKGGTRYLSRLTFPLKRRGQDIPQCFPKNRGTIYFSKSPFLRWFLAGWDCLKQLRNKTLLKVPLFKGDLGGSKRKLHWTDVDANTSLAPLHQCKVNLRSGNKIFLKISLKIEEQNTSQSPPS